MSDIGVASNQRTQTPACKANERRQRISSTIMTNLQKSQLQVQLNYAQLGPVAMSVVGVLGALFCAPPSMPVWLGSSSHVGPLWLFIPRARSRMCYSSAIVGKDLVLPLLATVTMW